jgi:hypothetical protein
VRTGDGAYYSLSCLPDCQLLRCRRAALEAFGLETWHVGESTCLDRKGRNVGLRLQLFAFCFCDGDELVSVIEIL